jgi:hypothetical protein
VIVMMILGLILLAAAVVLAIELIIANDATMTMHLWGWSWQMDAFWLAVGGAIILAVGLIGLALMQGGARRSRRLRRERRDLAEENRRLAARSERDERDHRAPVNAPAPADRPAMNRPATTTHTGAVAPGAGGPVPTHAAPETAYAVPADGTYDAQQPYPAQQPYDGEEEHRSRMGRVLHRR